MKEVPNHFPVSIDQAKRISRFARILTLCNDHLSPNNCKLIRQLGLKSLYLSELFKNEDWDGLNDILSCITEDIKRDDIPLLVEALKLKRIRIQTLEDKMEIRLTELNRKNKELVENERNLLKLEERIKDEVTFLAKYPKDVREFLIKHLGIAKNGALCLAKRLDYRWQKKLRKEGFIYFNEPPYYSPHFDGIEESDKWKKENEGMEYVYLVKDLDAIANDYVKRKTKGWGCEWEYDKEMKRMNKHSYWDIPEDSTYKNVKGLSFDLTTQLNQIKLEIQENKNEKESILKDIAKLKKTSPNSFIEAVEASNYLSEYDIKKHGEMQDKALWLFNRGYVAASEITLPHGKRCDVIGYNENRHIVIIEVKTSKKDFLRDEKWETYLPYCHEYYFFTSFLSYCPTEDRYSQIGFLEGDKVITIQKESNINGIVENAEQIIFSINRTLARKYIYGY